MRPGSDRPSWILWGLCLAVGGFPTLVPGIGCAPGAHPPAVSRPWPEPLVPVPVVPVLRGAGSCPAAVVPPSGAPVDMVLLYVGTGREFDEQPGPDGFVIRVVLLDGAYRAIRTPRARLTVGLYTPGGSQPVRLWQVEPQNLSRYWLPTRLLDGYLLRLSWADEPVAPGHYLFRVVWEGLSGGRLCREVFFQDRQERTPAESSAHQAGTPSSAAGTDGQGGEP